MTQSDSPAVLSTTGSNRFSATGARIFGTARGRVAALLIAGLGLAGCQQGSLMTTGFSSTAPSKVDRKALTERMYGTCAKETTPLFNRPSSPFVGKCECAAVSFLNYATHAQVDDLRGTWAAFGKSKAFVHKVLSLTDQFYTTHCGDTGTNGNALALTALRGTKSSAMADTTAEGVEMTTELNSESSIQSVPLSSSSSGAATTGPDVLRFALSPSALVDKDLVRYIQRKLKGLGYAPGPLDGIVGARTRAAIEAYRDAKGMPVDTPLEDVMSALLF